MTPKEQAQHDQIVALRLALIQLREIARYNLTIAGGVDMNSKEVFKVADEALKGATP